MRMRKARARARAGWRANRRIGGDGLICVAIGKWPELTPIRSDLMTAHPDYSRVRKEGKKGTLSLKADSTDTTPSRTSNRPPQPIPNLQPPPPSMRSIPPALSRTQQASTTNKSTSAPRPMLPRQPPLPHQRGKIHSGVILAKRSANVSGDFGCASARLSGATWSSSRRRPCWRKCRSNRSMAVAVRCVDGNGAYDEAFKNISGIAIGLTVPSFIRFAKS